jgi:L-threonylcarbamoyladenylate synthase
MPTDLPPLQLIRAAAARLRAGGVVAFPTETVYGLGADALSEVAVARVFSLKGRPERNPMIVHVSGPEMARRVVAEWTDRADRLARAFWPGPLTLVLRRAAALPGLVTGGGDTVGVRCPDHPAALALLMEFGGPLVGPSANPSGGVSPTTAAHVRGSFPESEVMVLDGGPCAGGIESTVLSLVEPAGRARILRPGLIGAPEISQVLGEHVAPFAPANHGASAPLPSPGLLSRHYAPRTPARLFDPSEWPEVLQRAGGSAVVLAHSALGTPHSALGTPPTLIPMPRDPEGYARRLYAALREADAAGASIILIERPPHGGAGELWSAIADRLNRATAPADNRTGDSELRTQD